MKVGVVIVNMVRGVVIDEVVLVEVFDFGYVSFVGLDVYENELDVYFGLLVKFCVFLVLYMGIFIVEMEIKMEEWVISNVCMVVEFGCLWSIVLEQKSMEWQK